MSTPGRTSTGPPSTRRSTSCGAASGSCRSRRSRRAEDATEESQTGFVSRRELGERLRAALARLPERAAEIFVLRHVEGYSNQEIGRLLGISWGSVAVTVHRARRRLQTELLAEGRARS